MAAGHAEPQMHPRVANLQTVFTAVGAGGYIIDLIEMCAVRVHIDSQINLPQRHGVTEKD